MFKFLKDKLKDAFKKFSKEVDQESKEVEETVKQLEDEAPAILKKKYPSEESKEHIVGIEELEMPLEPLEKQPDQKQEPKLAEEEEIEKQAIKQFASKKKAAKEEPLEEITFEETVEEEQDGEEAIEKEAAEQAAKDIPDIDQEVDKEVLKELGQEDQVASEESLDMPPPVEEVEAELVEAEIKVPERKEEPKPDIAEVTAEIKLSDESKRSVISSPKKNKPEEVSITSQKTPKQEEKKGFFSRLKEKIIGKEKEPEEEGFEEETAISPQDQEIQELAKEIEQPPLPIEVEEPVKKIVEPKNEEEKEKKKELGKQKEPELKAQKVDDELEELKQEGYHEVSLEPRRVARLPEEIDEEPEEKRGFFAKIADVVTKTTLSEEKFEELFWELEVALMENNVAVEVIDKIKGDLKAVLVNKKIQRGKSLDIIRKTLQHSIDDLFNAPAFDLVKAVRVKKPYIISFVGINGSGKTTTIAKIANMLKINNVSCIIAASDTFRAAAIQQLEEHAQKIGVKLIKHDYGADPAAVAFDAVKYAQAKSIDCVLIDTAGRLHSNTNLMDEMKKIIRIAKPDLKIFIGEAITGNDCIEQAKQFNKAIGIDGIILCKADVDDKGGAAISVSYVTGKPILYLGTGQKYTDLLKFDKKLIMDTISF